MPVDNQFAESVLATVARVKRIPRERISPERSLPELGFDSLDRVTLLFELEKQFQISIPDESVRSIETVRDVIEGISNLIAKAAAAEPGP